MKATTTAAIGLATAILITACVVLEDRLGDVTTPEIAAAAITSGCAGGREFIEVATAPLDPLAAALILRGVETACALRAKRAPVSATIYDDPLDGFCAEAPILGPDEADPATRAAFNTRRATICGAGQ